MRKQESGREVWKMYIMEKGDWIEVGGKTGIGQKVGPLQNDGLNPPM